jgi:hypothetical protein
MKRLALSVIGGFVIPFLYSIIVGPLTPYIKNPALDQLAMYPVRWPILLLFRLGFVPFENEIAILVYIIVCDVFLYSLLTYFLLWRLSKRKNVAQRLPPNPPTFV